MPVAILQNLTVVECAAVVTGARAAALLGNLGARVIKTESPHHTSGSVKTNILRLR